MKTITILTGFILAVASVPAHAQMQTLVVSPTSTNSEVINVSSNSCAVVKSIGDESLLLINVKGASFQTVENLTICGPATIQLRARCCTFPPSYATIEVIKPAIQLMPSTAVVIPADAGGPVNIILESSTDLISWTGALPGSYGTSTANRFFRVRAERTP